MSSAGVAHRVRFSRCPSSLGEGTLSFLWSHQWLGAFLGACAVLGWVGGQDAERYAFWSAPVVYVLIGRGAATLRPRAPTA